MKGKYKGQMKALPSESFAEPMDKGAPKAIGGMAGTHNDIGEKSGFETTGYIHKGDTPFGEDAKFNYLPPGMDIDNQKMLVVHNMPLRKVTAESYPGDGWEPSPRDVTE